jgi:hypothetical protein
MLYLMNLYLNFYRDVPFRTGDESDINNNCIVCSNLYITMRYEVDRRLYDYSISSCNNL